MIKRIVVLTGLLLLALVLPMSLYGQETAVSRTTEDTTVSQGLPTDQIIIKFVDASQMGRALSVGDDSFMTDLSETAGVALTYERAMALDAYVLKLPERMALDEVTAVASALSQRADVVYAEPDRIMQHFDAPNSPAPESIEVESFIYLPIIMTPNPVDPLRSQQWHYDYVPGSSEGINLYNAWGITTGSANVVVAVVDTGILNHEDLAGRTVPGYDFIHDSLVANDGDGRDANPIDPGDWITSAESSSGYFDGCPVSDSSWHGTHVAGTIGAATNNGIGVSGIDQNAKILPVRVLGKCGGYTSDIIDGVLWAAGFHIDGVANNVTPAKVVNLSLGGYGACSSTEQAAFTQLWNAGVLPVIAAGNDGAYAGNYSPGNCNNVITVAANDRTGDLAYYSNYGVGIIEVSAPGGAQIYANDPNGILSTLNAGTTTPGADNYEFYQGTSMATPHVAGVAALIYSVHPGYTTTQVRNLLQSTARPFAVGTTCYDYGDCGSGIVDAYQALNATLLSDD